MIICSSFHPDDTDRPTWKYGSRNIRNNLPSTKSISLQAIVSPNYEMKRFALLSAESFEQREPIVCEGGAIERRATGNSIDIIKLIRITPFVSSAREHLVELLVAEYTCVRKSIFRN